MELIIDFILKVITEFALLFMEMAPYLLLGFALAGILHVYFPKHKVAKYLGKKNLKSVVNAAILGVPLPLCSCGVIPTGVSFHKNGSSKGAAVSFLISTPQTGVDSILVTYSLLGLPFAIIRPLAAFITGVLGGAITNATDDSQEELFQNEPELVIKGSKVKAALNYAFVEFLQDISKWLLIGLGIAAVISAIVPDEFIGSYLSNPFVNMLLILVASIPMYVCATGSIPIAVVLMMKGLSPGAAFVFLMAGPATNAATITVIKQSMGGKALWSYLGSIIAGALITGLIINLLPAEWFTLPGLSGAAHQHGVDGLDWLSITSGIVLLLALLNGYRLQYFPTKKTITTMNNENDKVFTVDGMTCNHCKSTVEKNLVNLNKFDLVEVDLATKSVHIKGEKIDVNEVKNLVNELGYTFEGEQ